MNLKHKKSEFSLMFFLPCLVVIIAAIFSVTMTYIASKNNIKNSSQVYIKQFMNESEQKINSAINSASLLSSNSSMRDALMAETLTPSDETASVVKQLMQTYSCIDNVYIYSQSTHTALCNNEGFTAEDFFSNTYSYDLYNISYWNNLRFYNSAPYKVLLPTYVDSNDYEKNILPVVIRSSGTLKFNNLLVVNLNLRYLISTSTIPKISNNSEVNILNRYNNTIFNSGMVQTENNYPEDFCAKLTENNSGVFDYVINSKRSMVNYFSNTNSLTGYTYFVITPYSDIWKSILPMFLLNIIISIMFIILSVYLAFTNMSSTITSLNDLFFSFSKKSPDPKKNILLELKKSAADLYEQTANLKDTLPMAQSKYLIDFLNNADFLIDSKTKDTIKDTLPFSYDYYAVVIIRISFKSSLYDAFTQTECTKIRYGLYDLIRELFLTKIDCFVIVNEKDELYIIANAETSDRNDDIDSVIDDIKTAVLSDAANLDISVGKSKFYKDMIGLKKAHEEAVTSLNVVELSNNNIINTKKDNINFILKNIDETSLFNALLSYKIDTAISIISSIEEHNKAANYRSKQQLYQNILNIILKIIRLKNIPFKNDKMDFEIYNMILSLSPEEMHNNVFSILEYLREYASENSGSTVTNTINDIIPYIDNNFTDSSMSLETVATIFNLSVSNLSAMIKNKMGIGFHEYLVNLRLQKAKKLLLETDDPVSKISQECGFGSEKTFYRIFKKNIGVTPGDFRADS